MGYEIVKSGNGVKVKMGDKEYSPEEISAMILCKLKLMPKLSWVTKLLKPSLLSSLL